VSDPSPSRHDSPLPEGSPRAGGSEILEGRGVSVHFEGVKAVDDVDFTLGRGEILGLIGPNGAGKTTLVNVVTGFQRPTGGTVFLSGVDVGGWPPHRLARNGLARTFQNIRLFSDLTVLENVEVGGVGMGMRRRVARKQALELLDGVGLVHKATERASALPMGDERRLEVARALATCPVFLLLDEPAAGLNETESDELVTAVRGIRNRLGCGVLVIDHDMRVIMRLCERIQVLNYGRTISVGRPEEVRNDPAVIDAYLGTKSGRSRAAD
jgi:ABC-type branched-subunit amino acid transport system ATPase component